VLQQHFWPKMTKMLETLGDFCLSRSVARNMSEDFVSKGDATFKMTKR
jgi:hypothetical protein